MKISCMSDNSNTFDAVAPEIISKYVLRTYRVSQYALHLCALAVVLILKWLNI